MSNKSAPTWHELPTRSTSARWVYRIVAVLTALALLVFCTTLYKVFYVAPDSGLFPAFSTTPSAFASSASIPVRLYIPTIALDAMVQHVALSKSGAVGTPTNFSDVAWFEYSPAPGDKGNSIIDGHLDNALGLPGVFIYLDMLKAGDNIYVVTDSGERRHFKVINTEHLPYNTTATRNIFGETDKANLILITCSGDWDSQIKQYKDRTVVFSTLVQDPEK